MIISLEAIVGYTSNQTEPTVYLLSRDLSNKSSILDHGGTLEGPFSPKVLFRGPFGCQ